MIVRTSSSFLCRSLVPVSKDDGVFYLAYGGL